MQKDSYPSLVNFRDKYIFMTGGTRTRKEDSWAREVFRYNICFDSWSSLPSLNVGRQYHSSCVVESAIYVCGGVDLQGKYVEMSLEKLRVKDLDGFATARRWEVLDIPTFKMKNFLMVPITSNEILFLGGSFDGKNAPAASIINLMDMRYTSFPKILRQEHYI